MSIRFDEGFSEQLPYPEKSFDHVFSSFMFHHLGLDEKEKTLHEIRRVLKPGGFLHLLDFGGPGSRPDSFLARLLHFSHHLQDNFGGRILTFMNRTGFSGAKEVNHRATLFGSIAYYQAAVSNSETSTTQSGHLPTLTFPGLILLWPVGLLAHPTTRRTVLPCGNADISAPADRPADLTRHYSST